MVNEDYLHCSAYEGHALHPTEAGFSAFTHAESKLHFFALLDADGETLLKSEGYPQEASRENGIQSVIKNRTNRDFYSVKELEGSYYLSLRAANYREIARTCRHKTEAEALALLPFVTGEQIRKKVVTTPVATETTTASAASDRREDDYLACHFYENQPDVNHDDSMVKFTHSNGKNYFAWYDENNHLLMRSEGYPTTAARDNGYASVLKNRDLEERYGVEEKMGYYFAYLKAGNHQEIARACGQKTHEAAVAIFPSARAEFKRLAAAAAIAAVAPVVELPKVEVPTVVVAAPVVEMPKVEVPHVELPKVEIPVIAATVAAVAAAVPHVELPKVEIPHVELPKLEVPHVEVPHIELPKVSIPTVAVAAAAVAAAIPHVEIPKVEIPKVEIPKVVVETPKVEVPKVVVETPKVIEKVVAAAAVTAAAAAATHITHKKEEVKKVVTQVHTPVVETPVVEEAKGFNWWYLLPLLLIPLFFLYKNCNTETPVASVPTPTVTAPLPTVTPAPVVAETPKVVAPSCDLHWIYFDYDKSDIKSESKKELDHLAALLAENKGSVAVLKGFTDGNGDAAYNDALSKRRSAAARAYLVGTKKVGDASIRTAADGKNDPIAKNTTDDSGRKYNRRVELYLQDAAGKNICTSVEPAIPTTLKQ